MSTRRTRRLGRPSSARRDLLEWAGGQLRERARVALVLPQGVLVLRALGAAGDDEDVRAAVAVLHGRHGQDRAGTGERPVAGRSGY